MSTKRRVQRLYKAQDGRCHYCQLLIDLTTLQPYPRAPTIDHVIPISRGGKNTRENLVLACHFCNKRKGDMTGDEFRAFRRAIAVLGLSKREALRHVRSNPAQDSKLQ